jgi:hypothetical protein
MGKVFDNGFFHFFSLKSSEIFAFFVEFDTMFGGDLVTFFDTYIGNLEIKVWVSIGLQKPHIMKLR